MDIKYIHPPVLNSGLKKAFFSVAFLALALQLPLVAKAQAAEQPSKAAVVDETVAPSDKQEEKSEKTKDPPLTILDKIIGKEIREATDLEDLNDVLKNIESFGLMILLDTSGFDTKSVISEQELKTKAELNLRRNGIKLENVQGFIIAIRVQVLPLHGANSTKTDAYVFRTDLELINKGFFQRPYDGILDRPPGFFKVLASLYRQGGSGFAPAVGNSLKTAVSEMVVQNIEQFCNDYLSKNPEKIKLAPSKKKTPNEKPTAKESAPSK
jgi:hypothetical protein